MAFATKRLSFPVAITFLLLLLNILHSPELVAGFVPSSTRLRSCRNTERQQLSLAAVPHAASLPLILSSTSVLAQSEHSNDDENGAMLSLRSQLRRLTGFSLTALRATLRATTGISLTALYASTVAATSIFIRTVMKSVLSIFPTWFRYFLQPFLIMYYVPLYVVRSLTGPTRRIAKANHEVILESFKDAVNAAEMANKGYWPVHVNEEGFIEAVSSSGDSNQQHFTLTEAVAESVELAMETPI